LVNNKKFELKTVGKILALLGGEGAD